MKQRFPVCAVQAQTGNLNDKGEQQPNPASSPESELRVFGPAR